LQFKEDLETIKNDFCEQLDKQLKELTTKIADVTEEPEELPSHRGMLDRKLKLTGYPSRQRRNRLSVLEYDELKRHSTELFQQWKIRVSKSPYAALIVMVRKPGGTLRARIDCRAINKHRFRDSFPLPRIDDFIDKLREARCSTHLDLRSTYNQVRMPSDGPTYDSIATTAFQGLTPNGAPCLLKMLVMGFGLCNPPDICIYSNSPKEHLDHLRKVLNKLREN
jgi:hypothetical protein